MSAWGDISSHVNPGPTDNQVTSWAEHNAHTDGLTDLDQADDNAYEYEPCEHDHDETCYGEYGAESGCTHQHCINCGGCGCAGYCDDYQTYNLRPAETGGQDGDPECE